MRSRRASWRRSRERVTMSEQMSTTRVIAASPERVFAVLADPANHQEIEPTDWVRAAVDVAPIDHVGQMFSVNMYLEQAGGDYVMENKVTDFEQDRVIGWWPGQTPRVARGRPAAGGGGTTSRRRATARRSR
ncbi:hypothetical protein MTP03_20160 [Tsukamurella sp. PLM1]|nr:hypothetical protein MTP03_20160 [Tsukamurella sp. PLM1]